MKPTTDFCPHCGRQMPEPVHEEIRATVTVLDRRCEGCGTQLGEVRYSVALKLWACLSCYARMLESALEAAA